MRFGVTGATGFIGASLREALTAAGAETCVLARNPDRFRESLGARSNDTCEIIPGDLDDANALAKLCHGVDAVLHLAGVTHPRVEADYHRVNVEGAVNAARAAADAGARFVHVSSISAREPHLSPYAQSKASSETAIAGVGGDWRALRLPAIYGPRDKATLPYFKLIAKGFALEPRTSVPARASLLFAGDAAAAIIAGAKAPSGVIYEIGDDQPDGREWAEIGVVLAEVLGRSARPLRVPFGLVQAAYGFIQPVEGFLGREPSVRSGQAREFFHADWVARHNLLSDAVAWSAQTKLHDGFAQTTHWYRENGLL